MKGTVVYASLYSFYQNCFGCLMDLSSNPILRSKLSHLYMEYTMYPNNLSHKAYDNNHFV